jgi:hypothetical protein
MAETKDEPMTFRPARVGEDLSGSESIPLAGACFAGCHFVDCDFTNAVIDRENPPTFTACTFVNCKGLERFAISHSVIR